MTAWGTSKAAAGWSWVASVPVRVLVEQQLHQKPREIADADRELLHVVPAGCDQGLFCSTAAAAAERCRLWEGGWGRPTDHLPAEFRPQKLGMHACMHTTHTCVRGSSSSTAKVGAMLQDAGLRDGVASGDIQWAWVSHRFSGYCLQEC